MTTIDGYEPLARVFQDAMQQAATGKGRDRHAYGQEPFTKQLIFEIDNRLSGRGAYPLGQAVKKIYESRRLDAQAAQEELLGALVYIAAAVIELRQTDAPQE